MRSIRYSKHCQKYRARENNAVRQPTDRRSVDEVATLGTVLRWIANLLIRAYQLVISPVFYGLGVRCRFYPSCSEYAKIAITRHGLIRGGGLAAKRLLSCHPGHPGGVDHPPA